LRAHMALPSRPTPASLPSVKPAPISHRKQVGHSAALRLSGGRAEPRYLNGSGGFTYDHNQTVNSLESSTGRGAHFP
jgi:hypothetical protein